MMKLFPFLRYASLHNEEYSEVALPAQNLDSGNIRKAHTVPSLAQTLRPKVSHLEGCVDKRDRERRASFDERYTSSFPTTGGRAAEQRRQNIVAVPAVAPPVRPRRKTMDWCRNGSYISKPTRGWLHSDEQLIEGGVCYGVRYVGCLEVKMSMKSLDFETRTQVAKESITRVCEAAGLKCPDRKRKVEKRISKMLGDRPNMRHAGSNINFTVSTDNLSLVIMESGEIIATHQMQGISFASGGDPETLDFVAYVAKDASGRACYVLECGGGLAQDVITTIGQAFELRFKEYLKKAPKPVTVPNRIEEPLPERSAWGDDPEYYNDMPGKEPPPHPPLPTRTHLQSHLNAGRLDADLQRVPPHEPRVPNAPRNNIGVGGATGFTGDPVSQEMFDPVMPAESPPPPPSRIDSSIHESCPLEEEVWFHQNLSRKQAERLVQRDGDYLVRESSQCPGQYVLTGMQSGQVKHLLLVDPEGVVRTKDRVFESVSHLIDFHRQNRIPITSTESSLHLYNAVISDLSNP